MGQSYICPVTIALNICFMKSVTNAIPYIRSIEFPDIERVNPISYKRFRGRIAIYSTAKISAFIRKL